MQTQGQAPNWLRQIRRVLWLLVAVAAVGAAALFLLPREQGGQSAMQLGAGAREPFTLVTDEGLPFASSRLDGRPHAIFFGFTHCPDVCPTTLARLTKLRGTAGGERAFDIVFVSIDPARDTPAVMREYARQFGTPIIALTGSPAQIEIVKKRYGIFAEKAQPAGAGHEGHQGYSMNHTSAVLLFDRDGRSAGTIAAGDDDAAALAKLEALAS